MPAYAVFRYTDPFHRGLGYGVERSADHHNIYPLVSLNLMQAQRAADALNEAFEADKRAIVEKIDGRPS